READARNQGLERLAIGRRIRGREREPRPAVEAALERDDGPAGHALRLRARARELERRVEALGAGGAEGHAREAGPRAQLLRQLDRRLVREQVRAVPQPRELRGDRLGEAGRRVAERVHRDAAREVEVLVAAGVADAGAVSLDELEARQWI